MRARYEADRDGKEARILLLPENPTDVQLLKNLTSAYAVPFLRCHAGARNMVEFRITANGIANVK